MYFSKVSINPASLNIEKLAGQICVDSYKEHQQIWQLFKPDPDAGRDFLFRREQINGWPVYYVVSERRPDAEQQLWSVEHKQYCPKLYSGQQLAFRLRVNPVVSRTDDKGKKRRHDVVMDLKKQMDYQQQNKNNRPYEMQLVQQAGIAWLQKRAAVAGFEFCDSAIRVDAYTRHQSVKTSQKKMIRYSTLDYEGLLTVADPKLCLQALFKGVGPAKAFGCGLLLVKPVSQY